MLTWENWILLDLWSRYMKILKFDSNYNKHIFHNITIHLFKMEKNPNKRSYIVF